MKEKLNGINNKNVIKLAKDCNFCFLEEPIDLKSPVSEYYFKINDLSLNVKFKLKWVLYGYFFLKSISQNVRLSEPGYETSNLFADSINSDFKYPNAKHVISIDDVDVTDIDAFVLEINNEYSKIFYNENSTVHLKIKVNVDDFVVLQNTSHPRLHF